MWSSRLANSYLPMSLTWMWLQLKCSFVLCLCCVSVLLLPCTSTENQSSNPRSLQRVPGPETSFLCRPFPSSPLCDPSFPYPRLISLSLSLFLSGQRGNLPLAPVIFLKGNRFPMHRTRKDGMFTSMAWGFNDGDAVSHLKDKYCMNTKQLHWSSPLRSRRGRKEMKRDGRWWEIQRKETFFLTFWKVIRRCLHGVWIQIVPVECD